MTTVIFDIIFLLIFYVLGYITRWVMVLIKREKEIEKFIMNRLSTTDKIIYNKHLKDIKFNCIDVVIFLKNGLSKNDYLKFRNLAKIKYNVKKVTSTKGLYRIEGEVYNLPKYMRA